MLLHDYTLPHLFSRRGSTAMTIVSIGLVVFVFVAAIMLSSGLEETLTATGSPQNVLVVRSGADNEIQSGISREQLAIVLAEPEVERRGSEPFATRDVVAIVALKKRNGGEPSNVNIRGSSGFALALRDAVKVVEGRPPSSGTREVMVGRAIHAKFAGTGIGESLRIVGTNWPIVGIFDSGKSAFNSEVWADGDVVMPAFRREQYSSGTFRLRPAADLEAMQARVAKDPRLNLWLKRENEFYADQSETLATFILTLGSVISVIFGMGAVVAAAITMYSAVAARTREIGILRALGFSRRQIFTAFACECLGIAFLGGVLGVLLASLTEVLEVSTANFQTFAEIAFSFDLTVTAVVAGMLFALAMGLIGGALPAFRAARLDILQALRAP